MKIIYNNPVKCCTKVMIIHLNCSGFDKFMTKIKEIRAKMSDNQCIKWNMTVTFLIDNHSIHFTEKEYEAAECANIILYT